MLNLRRKAETQQTTAKGRGKEPRRRVGLSQWDLMLIKFRRNRLAVVSGWIVLAIYLAILFADFLAPYSISA